MKEIIKTVTAEQTVYEITKEELDKIKKIERTKGREDIVEYLRFVLLNYYLKINIGAACQIVEDICDFIKYGHSIKNTRNISFDEFVGRYRS